MQEPRWTSVYTCATEYEAHLLKGNLEEAGFQVVILSRKDHANVLNVGDLAVVDLMVAADRADEARALIEQQDLDRDLSDTLPVTEAELEAAAMAADPVQAEADLRARLQREDDDRNAMADEANNFFPGDDRTTAPTGSDLRIDEDGEPDRV